MFLQKHMTPFGLKKPYYFLDVLNLIPLLTSFHCILLKDRRAAQLCRMVLMASLCKIRTKSLFLFCLMEKENKLTGFLCSNWHIIHMFTKLSSHNL